MIKRIRSELVTPGRIRPQRKESRVRIAVLAFSPVGFLATPYFLSTLSSIAEQRLLLIGRMVREVPDSGDRQLRQSRSHFRFEERR